MTLSFDPNNPIPNQPFFYPPTWQVAGPLGPLVVGTNLSVDATTGTLNATPQGGIVTSITAGQGLTGGTITSTGTISLAPTGVAAGVYTSPTLTLNGLGQIVAITSSLAPGTVCCVQTGTGLTGGPITTSGTIAIASTGVIANSYPYACIAVNPEGQITAATSCVPVTSITAGTGLSGGTITSTGTINLANTAVTPGSYCYPTLDVDQQGRITNIVSNNVVSCITTGAGLVGGPITTTGQIALTNTGVTAGSYTLSSVDVDAQGRITNISNGTAVTNISTGVGLTGGPITTTGTIALSTISPSPAGSYTFASVNVDAYGRVSSASSGSLCSSITATAPVVITGNNTAITVSVNEASTTTCGAVRLTNDTSTNSTTTALTAAQGYSLQQQIDALTNIASNLTLVGTFDATLGQMLTVTSLGTAEGFTVGFDLVAPAVANENSFVVITVPGSYSPPGGGGPYALINGDWLISNGTAWQYFNLGNDIPFATTTSGGIVELATLAEVQTGTDSTRAVTPDTIAQTYVKNSSYTNKGAILAGTGVGTYSALLPVVGEGHPIVSCSTALTGVAYGCLPINQDILTTKGDIIVANSTNLPERFALGTAGQVLTVDTTQPQGVAWCAPAQSIPLACFTGKGTLIAGSAALTPASLASSGNNGDLLQVCTACSTGLYWGPLAGFIPCSLLTGKGDLIAATNAATPVALNPGTDGYVLASCSTASAGLTWINRPPAILCCCITGKGALVTGTAANTPVALPVGANGTILYANSACTEGLEWVCYVPAIPCACLTAKGTIISASAASTPEPLVVGTNGQVLTACSGCASGLTWATPTADIPCSVLTGKGALVTATAASTPTALAVGSDWTTLVSCAACTSGLAWATYGVGPWVNAGFIENVGWSSTGGAVVVGPWTRNNVSYRRLGQKEWEVVYSFFSVGSPVNIGNGDYLFTLPNGLAFNTTLDWQLPWQGQVGVASYLHSWFILPGHISSNVQFADNSNSSIYSAGVAPWDATRFRFIASDSLQTRPQAMGSSYYGLNANLAFKFAFRFTSA